MGLMRLVDAKARGIISREEYQRYLGEGRRRGDRLVFDVLPKTKIVMKKKSVDEVGGDK